MRGGSGEERILGERLGGIEGGKTVVGMQYMKEKVQIVVIRDHGQ